jgi:hypothetical protein
VYYWYVHFLVCFFIDVCLYFLERGTLVVIIRFYGVKVRTFRMRGLVRNAAGEAWRNEDSEMRRRGKTTGSVRLGHGRVLSIIGEYSNLR